MRATKLALPSLIIQTAGAGRKFPVLAPFVILSAVPLYSVKFRI